MFKKYKILKYDKVLLVFLILELFLYLIFLYLDIVFNPLPGISNIIKYISIIICFIFVCYQYLLQKNMDTLFIVLGMLFTLCADWFLIFRELFIVGISFFILVHISYMIRLVLLKDLPKPECMRRSGNINKNWKKLNRVKGYKIKEDIVKENITKENVIKKNKINEYKIKRNKKKKNKIKKNKIKESGMGSKVINNSQVSEMILRIAGTMIVPIIIHFTFLCRGIKIQPLILTAMIYFLYIINNTAYSLKAALLYKNNFKIRTFAIGMFFFLLCDINVGIFNLRNYMVFTNVYMIELYELSSVSMWMFYLPSQVCIALSVYRFKCKLISGQDDLNMQ